jgi:hypothetical protein
MVFMDPDSLGNGADVAGRVEAAMVAVRTADCRLRNQSAIESTTSTNTAARPIPTTSKGVERDESGATGSYPSGEFIPL